MNIIDIVAPPGVFLGNGDGTFQLAGTFTITIPVMGSVSADLNGDGNLDIATTGGNTPADKMGIYIGRGDGTFEDEVTYVVGTYTRGLVAGDFNADGWPDIAVAVAGSAAGNGEMVMVFLNAGDGTFPSGVSYAAQYTTVSILAQDFNTDGILDLIAGNWSSGSISYLEGNGDGTFKAALSYGLGRPVGFTETGDFDENGLPDLAVSNGGSGTVTVLLNAGCGSGAPQQPRIRDLSVHSTGTDGGAAIRIVGSGFRRGAGVTIGEVSATNVVVLNDTIIICTVPAGVAGTADVVVLNPDAQQGTLTGGFVYFAGDALSVDSVSPPVCPTTGGLSITIVGSGFQSGATVTFGGVSATDIVVVSATEITCTLPAGSEGPADVTVTNPGGSPVTLSSGFTYAQGILLQGRILAEDTAVIGVVNVLQRSGGIFVPYGSIPTHDVSGEPWYQVELAPGTYLVWVEEVQGSPFTGFDAIQVFASVDAVKKGTLTLADNRLDLETADVPFVADADEEVVVFGYNGSAPDDSVWSRLAISSDGRCVAYWSASTNLVYGDTNVLADVFVTDRKTGRIDRVSIASDGTQADAGAGADLLAISSDGRYVAFRSGATTLVGGDTNEGVDVFRHDRLTGETIRTSVASDGSQGTGNAYTPAMSADGRYVAFMSDSTDLVPSDTNNYGDVFVHDCLTGTTERVSLSSVGAQVSGGGMSPAINGDGRYVLFYSGASDLVLGDTNSQGDLFVRDRLDATTERVSLASDGSQANEGADEPAFSADGRYAFFRSAASTLVPADTNDGPDIFLRDRQAATTECVSLNSDGLQGTSSDEYSLTSYFSASSDARYVAFMSKAENFGVDMEDFNSPQDFNYVRDRATARTILLGGGLFPMLSADGRYVAVLSNGLTVLFNPLITDGPAPTVTSVSPSSGHIRGGTAVTIAGSGFQDGASVTFGGDPATEVVVVSDASITCTTPAGLQGSADVRVRNTDTQFRTLFDGFDYIFNPSTAPIVSAVSPSSGPASGGTEIAISGLNFQEGATVTIGGTPATGVHVVDPWTIVCTTPTGSGAASVRVANPDTQASSLAEGFAYADD